MSSPNKTSSGSGVNWQLIGNEFKVMEQYSCHDGKAGLSTKDVEYFKKTNPELFEEMMDAYPRMPGPGSVKYSQSANDFIDNFANIGFRNLAAAVAEIIEPVLGKSNWARPISNDGDQLLQGVFQYFDQSKVPAQLNRLQALKNSLEKGFRERGVPIKSKFIIMVLGKDRFNNTEHGLRLEFPTGPCKKPGKETPNV